MEAPGERASPRPEILDELELCIQVDEATEDDAVEEEDEEENGIAADATVELEEDEEEDGLGFEALTTSSEGRTSDPGGIICGITSAIRQRNVASLISSPFKEGFFQDGPNQARF